LNQQVRSTQEHNKTQAKGRRFEHWQIISIPLMLYDFVAVCGAYFLALFLRFDCVYSAIQARYMIPYKRFILPYAAFCILLFVAMKLYNSVWRYASYTELNRTLAGSMIASAIHTVLITVLFRRMPVSYYLMGAFFQCALLIIARFAPRFVRAFSQRKSLNYENGKRIMLIGAGNAGQMILREMVQATEIQDRVVCIIDDDPSTWHRYINNIPIVGGRDDILANVERYNVDEIFLAIPSASAQDKRDILAICSETNCKLKQLPGLYQFVVGQATMSAMRDVSVEDLLGRDPIQNNMKDVYSFITNKVVLVTGGGGSIGSELCRQVAAHNPKQLIIFDIYENNAYSIQLELQAKYPNLDLVTLIGSVRDSRRMFEVFETYRPQVVYHAAAHKHVPLMEDSPCEAIKNNVIGTYKTAYAAMIHGCSRFVLISTDKAVNPTNIMGASKRLCEMIIQFFDEKIKSGKANEIPQLFTHGGIENADKDGTGKVFENIKTEFVAVRFGNVLGSNGSVIPIFKKQIEKGGPVTVTHPDIVRYFMTIPEAVSLVMLAGVYARGGEIFVLEMGDPVKIDTLARNMIKLSGYRPDVDIKIVYTGLRPGEKLYEEKLMAEEGLKKTDNNLIYIGNPIKFDFDTFPTKLEILLTAAYANREDIRERMKDLVSTYHPGQTEEIKISA
jgi:FlaA1/EpsC-like NDP-sugar epimerase